jgi:hypothetical protein
MSPTPAWVPFEQGATLGTRGSESGLILLDEEYKDAARISLERDAGNFPFAITCGIYWLIMHTRFFGEEADARNAYDAMKLDMQAIVDGIDSEDPAIQGPAESLLNSFTGKYPT